MPRQKEVYEDNVKLKDDSDCDSEVDSPVGSQCLEPYVCDPYDTPVSLNTDIKMGCTCVIF